MEPKPENQVQKDHLKQDDSLKQTVHEIDYGGSFQTHLLEQYKIYVEMADRVSARRLQTGSFYISLLSGLLAIISITGNKALFDGSQKIVLFSISLLGIALCCLWGANINSYKQLNSLKFKVIHEMEQFLPFACYEREWQFLQKNQSGKKYFRLTALEQYIPIVIAIPYLLILIYSIIQLIN